MNKKQIEKALVDNFNRWFKTAHWNLKPKDMTETHVKQYLGYFGINNRG